MQHLYQISDQVLCTDLLTPDGRLAELMQALDFVTSDEWADDNDNWDFWHIHAGVMDKFFEENNDGDSCDWSWEQVLPYWSVVDLAYAYQQWEDTHAVDH